MALPNSILLIREISGLERSLRLVGAGLPFRGAPWGSTQRVTTTWYPGNSTQATQHILGPTEKQSSWDGFWRTTQLSRSPATFIDENGKAFKVTNAFTLMQLADDLFRGGQTLSVEWTDNLRDQDRRIVREGVAADWEFTPDRADDIGWTVTWDWSGRGGQQQKVVAFRTENLLAAIRETIIVDNEFAEFEENLKLAKSRRDVRKSADKFTLGQLENLANAPLEFTRSITRKVQQITNRLKKMGELILKVRSIPTQLANQGLDLANNTIAISNQFIDEISRKPPEALAARSKLAVLTQSASFYGTGIRQAELMRRSAQGLRTQVQGSSTSKSTIIAVHVVRAQSESLASISLKFYKTPEYGPGIAKANALPLHQLTAARGDVLIIPTVDVVKGFSPKSG